MCQTYLKTFTATCRASCVTLVHVLTLRNSCRSEVTASQCYSLTCKCAQRSVPRNVSQNSSIWCLCSNVCMLQRYATLHQTRSVLKLPHSSNTLRSSTLSQSIKSSSKCIGKNITKKSFLSFIPYPSTAVDCKRHFKCSLKSQCYIEHTVDHNTDVKKEPAPQSVCVCARVYLHVHFAQCKCHPTPPGGSIVLVSTHLPIHR